ncbi:MAG: lysophospholipid acyltransferase family protein [Brevinema sp.]
MAKRHFTFLQRIMMGIEAVILLPLIHIISFLISYKYIYPLTKFIGRFFIFLNQQKKKDIEENLKIIYPDKIFDHKELIEISSVIAGYDLRIILEMIAFSKMSFHKKLSYIKIADPKFFVQAFANPFIGMTLHYGNWELLGHFFNTLGVPLGVLVERQFNPIMDRYLQYRRKKLALTPIYNEISQMKPLFKFLKDKKSLALVADQTYWFDPLFLDFFGKQAAVPMGPAGLVLKSQFPLYYAYTEYQHNGIYLLQVGKPFSYQISADKEQTQINIMKSVYQRYEETIIRDIKNWYSLGFPRWKLTPTYLEEWKKNPDSSRY